MKPFITRDKCGTESGYRKHRRMGEKRCPPCTEAHNVHRRATYKPEKNSQYKNKYKEKPEVQEAIREYHKRYNPSLGRAMTDEEYAAFLEAKKERKRAKQEEKRRKYLLWKILRLLTKRKELLERIDSIPHGTTYAAAHRCRRYFGRYCDLCKPVEAAYVRERHHRLKDELNAKRRAYRKRVGHPPNNRQRAIKAGVKHEYYTRKHIFERDGYNCYLCGIPVDLSGSYIVGQPGWELYPHIEHVIPISKGGSDTLDNVKIAHAKCNLIKGTQIIDNSSTTAYDTEN